MWQHSSSHLATEITSLYTCLKAKRHIRCVDLVDLSTEMPYVSHHTMTPGCKADNAPHAEVLCSKSPHPQGDGAHPFGTSKVRIHLEPEGRSSNDLARL